MSCQKIVQSYSRVRIDGISVDIQVVFSKHLRTLVDSPS